MTAASTSLYPTGLINGDPLTPAFKLGSYWSDGGSGTRCTEFAELTDAQKAMLSDPANRGRALANMALYLFDLDLLRRVIEQNSLKLHLQRHKKVQDQSGALVPCTKFEYFLPDLPELTGRYGGTCRLMLLRDTSGLSEPLRDLTVDALPAKDIGKLALSQRAKLYCDRQKCVEAGLAVEDGALVEIGPFARISAEEGAVIRSGARIYIGGTSDAPVHAVFKKSADLRGEMRITQSCEIR